MKPGLHRLIPVLALLTLSSFGSALEEVVSAIRTGDYARISKHFDEVVTIAIDERSNTFGRSQSEMVLRDFFSQHPVKDFTVERQLEEGTGYFTGILHAGGLRFRTTVLMRQRGDRKRIRELRFERLEGLPRP